MPGQESYLSCMAGAWWVSLPAGMRLKPCFTSSPSAPVSSDSSLALGIFSEYWRGGLTAVGVSHGRYSFLGFWGYG